MSAHEAAIEFIERAGLNFHVGSSVVAIAAGDLARARYHLERAERVAGPSLPMPVVNSTMVEPIPELTVGHGVAPVRHGQTRRCAKCGESKGGTAFRRGSDVCTKCEKETSNAQEEDAQRLKPYPVERPTLTKSENAQRAAYWRECTECKRKLGVRAFRGSETVCRQCEGDE